MKGLIYFSGLLVLALFVATCQGQQEDRSSSESGAAQKVLTDQSLPTESERQVSLATALAHLNTENRIFDRFLENGSMFVGLYTPRDADKQQPHDQDEVYIIMKGSGTFLNGTEKTSFQTGDVIFVPAGETHRFETFTEDFAAWVVFY